MAAKQDHAQVMPSLRRNPTLAVVLLVLAACKTDSVRDEAPARIVEPTPESRTELQRVVSEALKRESITLADDALTDSSFLLIEPAHLMGRDLRKPEQFQLVLSGSGCVLVHTGSGARYELIHTNCTAEAN
jgi:hypothetical protein